MVLENQHGPVIIFAKTVDKVVYAAEKIKMSLTSEAEVVDLFTTFFPFFERII